MLVSGSKGFKTIPREKIARMGELIEPWFIFALIWSVGATGDSLGREAFSSWLRKKMAKERVSRGEKHIFSHYRGISSEEWGSELNAWRLWMDFLLASSCWYATLSKGPLELEVLGET